MAASSDAPQMIMVPLPSLERFVGETFSAMGLTAEQAAIAGGALIFSELRFLSGQGQGVRRLRVYRDRIKSGLIDLNALFEIVKESPALALVDGHNGVGSVTATKAMRLAVQKAKICGIGTVIVRNGTHYGSSSVHVAEAVKAGCIGTAYTNASPEMAAWGGVEAVVGTNPWGIGAPSGKGFPVILDIALTTAGKGMMQWYRREGRRMPLDWALTPAGEETDDPAAALTGALLGIGQYKGYGLSFMTDVLTGVIGGGGFGVTPGSDPLHQDTSHSFTAIDIGWFMPIETFTQRMDQFIDTVKGGRLRPGFKEIFVPGEIESRRVAEKTTSGVPIERLVCADLAALGDELGVQVPAEMRTGALISGQVNG